ncbi:hypothetical protein SRB5_37220 [Streptomyces sp. RB5]|uniref:Uncharacterized protein n=1 Tax=Streptomyces smaragdinus TaxID=2585196 RepID=A0A7K0CLE2_9ACTN|nr:DUF5819 family protein [Streptomyces smaragdinus]MQY13574.1 hypothetical protein [Streptomyces smaragdinus]
MQSLSRGRRYALACAAVGAALAAVLHLTAVFFAVAPANAVSDEYRTEIDGYIYPWFEQHWALFSPNPFQENYRIDARTSSAGRVSGWSDLSAFDNEAMRHNPYPARVNQNMLRRAWKIYRNRGDLNAPARTERAELFRVYLRTIAVARLAELGRPAGYDALQLRVTTLPIAPPAGRGPARPASALLLPWWKVPVR